MKKIILGIVMLFILSACGGGDDPELKITSFMINGIETTSVSEGVLVELSVKATFEDEERDLEIINIESENASIILENGMIKYLISDKYTTDIITINVVDTEGKRAKQIVNLSVLQNPTAKLQKILIDGSDKNRIEMGEEVTLNFEFSNDVTINEISSDNGYIVQNGSSYTYTAPLTEHSDCIRINISDQNGNRDIVEEIDLIHTKPLTFMLYLGGDNNLDSFAIGDLKELVEANIDVDNVNVVIYLDLMERETENTRGYIVYTGDEDDSIEISPTAYDSYSPYIKGLKMVKYIGEKNSGNWETLKDFLDYTATNYPAEKYILDLWDHGDGWLNDKYYTNPFNETRRAMVSDSTSNGDDLSLWEMEYAILNSLLTKVDLIYTDACFMGTVEVAYQLKDVTDYIYFSPELTPGDGGEYEALLNVVSENYNQGIEEIGKDMITANLLSYNSGGSQHDGYNLEAIVYTLIDTSKTDAFVTKFESFASQTLEEINTIQAIPAESFLCYGYEGGNDYNIVSDYVDLGSILTQMTKNDNISIELKAKASDLLDYINNREEYIIDVRYQNGEYIGYDTSWEEDTCGVSIYVPFEGMYAIGGTVDGYYKNATRFAQDTNWGEFVKRYYYY